MISTQFAYFWTDNRLTWIIPTRRIDDWKLKKGGAIGKGHNFIREIKQRPDIHLLEMTHANRNRLQEAIVEELMINLC